MKYAVGAFVASLAVIVGGWWWLGRPVAMPAGLEVGAKLPCVSYAPFGADQTPLRDDTRVTAAQIEADLAQLAKITSCVRTYSIEHGVDQVPAIAAKYGLKVMQGIWLSRLADKNRWQIDTAIALAKRHPDVISAVIVGNEVLLRGELSANQLGDFIREVKKAVPVPVTYADVWEFWLRHRDLVDAVDFVTVHILPYWEDFPVAADKAAAHTDDLRRQVAASFAGKDILIGEFGWPSAGRMREGALPSPSNQARVIQEVLALAARENYRVNVIEAYDQPWKRRLEGTVGGHWGIIPADRSGAKFSVGAPVSDHPLWRWQAAGGALLAAAVVAIALLRRRPEADRPAMWLGVAFIAMIAGMTVPWAIALVPVESLGVGGWARGLALAAVAAVTPLLAAAALAAGDRVPSFAQMLGDRGDRAGDLVTIALGVSAMAATVLAIQTALGLVFDARYRDLPFAPLSGAILPLVIVSLLSAAGGKGAVGTAERLAAAILAPSAVYVVLNESFSNWQAVWVSALLAALAAMLVRQRDAQS